MGEQIKEHVTRQYPNFHVNFAVQPEMKGQSDAFWQAREFLHGPMLMAFSDTLIDNDFSFLANETQGVAFVKPVPDPRRFGVAEVDQKRQVVRLIEKPQELKNNLAVVGCYYFEEAEDLISAIEEQIKRNISLKNEFFLVDAINIMLERGMTMRTEMVNTWLDAGTTEALLETNRYLLEHGQDNSKSVTNLEDTVIIPPVNIHPTARINTAVIGPHVSLGEGAVVNDSTIRDSIIGSGTHVTGSLLEGSVIGHNVNITNQSGRFNIGDDSWAVK